MIDTVDWAQSIGKYLYDYMELLRVKQTLEKNKETTPDYNMMHNKLIRKCDEKKHNLLHTINSIEDYKL